MYKIQTITAGSAVASLDFTVPSGYDDLYIVFSARSARTGVNTDDVVFQLNTDASNQSTRILWGTGSAVQTLTDTQPLIGEYPTATATSDTFGNYQVYIPNYGGTAVKSFSADGVSENNGTLAYQSIAAGLYNSTSAITSIRIKTGSGSNLVQGSTATLYGIRKYNTTATPKATGGIITYKDGYWYHTFTASGTFTPTQSLSCDYLVVAGGGGGANNYGGGGGAGGYRTGSASLSATGYTVTVGAGGTGGVSGGTGGNSSFNALTSDGGGGGGQPDNAGNNGGSGGGAGGSGAANRGGGTGISGQGNNGGANFPQSGVGPAGGGGGASAVGATATSSKGGDGGAGSTWLNGTTYAGGGGGGTVSGTGGTGGSGGGGAGSASNAGTVGQIATGGGGGGGGGASGAGANGGSGIVIVRYAA